MSDHDSLRHIRMAEDAIEKARNGNAAMERFLRLRIAQAAYNAPLRIVLLLSQVMIDNRKRELDEEAESN